MLLSPAEVFPWRSGAPTRTVIDVRSPVEVARGALPGARALPLMSDEERHQVGVRYKEAGQEAAIALGYALAGPYLPQRVAAWREAAASGPVAVACWRGGLRSRLAVEFIDRPDVDRVEGGYKALRRHLVDALPRAVEAKRTFVLSGLTGSGKTRVLRRLHGRAPGLQVLDLEGEANHRGSAFGAATEAQPSQQTFENALAAQLLLDPSRALVVEDESRYVGRRTVPDALLRRMRASPVVLLEVPLETRVRHIFEEYVLEPSELNGVDETRARLERDTQRIRKRLGGGRADAVAAALRTAAESGAWRDPEAHRGWITTLLERYYDRLYRKAFAGHDRTVVFRGDAAEVAAYLRGLPG